MARQGDERPEAVTELLRRLAAGDGAAGEPLLDNLYAELRAIAARHLSRERPDHTLQPTALVHEAWIRLSARPDRDVPSRGHFLSLASRVMRSLLVDHARRRHAEKRGGARELVPLDDMASVDRTGQALDVLALDEALTRLETIDPERARLVELRYFAGAAVSDVADATGLPLRTVERRLRSATAWLRRELES